MREAGGHVGGNPGRVETQRGRHPGDRFAGRSDRCGQPPTSGGASPGSRGSPPAAGPFRARRSGRSAASVPGSARDPGRHRPAEPRSRFCHPAAPGLVPLPPAATNGDICDRGSLAAGQMAPGLSAVEAARAVGVGLESVCRWAKLAGMNLQPGRRGGLAELRPAKWRVSSGPRLVPGGPYVDANGRLDLTARTVIQVRLRRAANLSTRSPPRSGWRLQRCAREIAARGRVEVDVSRQGLHTVRRWRPRARAKAGRSSWRAAGSGLRWSPG